MKPKSLRPHRWTHTHLTKNRKLSGRSMLKKVQKQIALFVASNQWKQSLFVIGVNP